MSGIRCDEGTPFPGLASLVSVQIWFIVFEVVGLWFAAATNPIADGWKEHLSSQSFRKSSWHMNACKYIYINTNRQSTSKMTRLFQLVWKKKAIIKVNIEYSWLLTLVFMIAILPPPRSGCFAGTGRTTDWRPSSATWSRLVGADKLDLIGERLLWCPVHVLCRSSTRLYILNSDVDWHLPYECPVNSSDVLTDSLPPLNKCCTGGTLFWNFRIQFLCMFWTHVLKYQLMHFSLATDQLSKPHISNDWMVLCLPETCREHLGP